MTDMKSLLETCTTIELVDWPRAELPAALDLAGYVVVGHEPDGYKRYQVTEAALPDGGPSRTFPLKAGGFLLSQPIAGLPAGIDIVSTFRPAEEQVEIVRDAIAAGARAFWVEPGEGTSPEAREIALGAGLAFFDGESIQEAVERLGVVAARKE